MRKRLKPPSAHICPSNSGWRPSVPSPAPPGSDRADDMQLAMEKPYIIAAIGLTRLSWGLGVQRMSLINQVPSGVIDRRIAPIVSAGRVMSWRQSKGNTRYGER